MKKLSVSLMLLFVCVFVSYSYAGTLNCSDLWNTIISMVESKEHPSPGDDCIGKSVMRDLQRLKGIKCQNETYTLEQAQAEIKKLNGVLEHFYIKLENDGTIHTYSVGCLSNGKYICGGKEADGTLFVDTTVKDKNECMEKKGIIK